MLSFILRSDSVHGRTVGMVVDGVSDVILLAAEQIRPTANFSSPAFDTQYITGLGTLDQRILILVDVEKLVVKVNQELPNA